MRPRTRAFIFGMAVALALFGGVLQAQTRVVSVRVFPDADGALITVDGVTYSSATTLLWPEGSKHLLSVPYPQVGVRPGTAYTFGGWSTNLGPLSEASPAITADRDLTYVKASFTVSYAVALRFYACSGTPQSCAAASPGRVYLNGGLYTGDADVYVAKGSTVTVEAYPNPGFVFQGWVPMAGIPNSNAFQFSFPLYQPQMVAPMFRSAVSIQLTVESSPPGLKILADRTPVWAPYTLDWGFDTVHSLGTLPVQYDAQGQLWIFDSWSDGGAINHDFNMQAATQHVTVTARFVPGAAVTFLTEPPSLKLKIDNRDNWPSYTFQWAAGTTHPVSAPLEQTDARGRKYRFQGWSDGKAAAYDYKVASAPADVRVTAVYKPVAQITLSTYPAGLQVGVDGQNCVTPCSIEREVGTSVRITAAATYQPDDGTRLVFQGWTDGGSAEHDVTASEVPLRLEAAYSEQNRLTVAVDPSDTAICRINPGAPDGYYDRGTLVTVQINPKPGNRFVAWSGDATGTKPSAVVEMNGPKRLFARLDAVPYVQPAGVRNAAAETPVDAVAPGSIISILGVNLAPSTESSPDNPLAQTLASVTVRMADRLLPLVMVSPEEIRAQLPSDTQVGAQRLAVRWGDKPEVSADFQVARNAPGLFFKQVDDRAFALAVRPNGEAVEPGASVHRGETITLFGTGFGPYVLMPPDGFALPEAPGFRLADPVEVALGDAVLTPVYAGAGTQSAGLNALRLRIPDSAAGGELPVLVRVNGVESNTVLLRVE